jgi:hypothetical protein
LHNLKPLVEFYNIVNLHMGSLLPGYSIREKGKEQCVYMRLNDKLIVSYYVVEAYVLAV